MHDALVDQALLEELVGDRPRPAEQWEELFAGSWPAYVDADPVAALAPLRLDLAADRGRLAEPGIWVRHR